MVKYFLREEGWQLVEKNLVKEAVTVDHAKKELLNAVWKHCLIRRIIDKEIAMELRMAFDKLVDTKILIIESEENYADKAFEIALTHNLSYYDSLYLAQSLKWGKLLTSDELQREIAEKLSVETIFIP